MVKLKVVGHNVSVLWEESALKSRESRLIKVSAVINSCMRFKDVIFQTDETFNYYTNE